METFSFVGFGTCAVCRVSQSWGDAVVPGLAAVTSASGSSFGDSGVSGMQFLMGFGPPDYQRFGGSPKELGGKLPGHGIIAKDIQRTRSYRNSGWSQWVDATLNSDP